MLSYVARSLFRAAIAFSLMGMPAVASPEVSEAASRSTQELASGSLVGEIDLVETARRQGLATTPANVSVELREERDGFFGDPASGRADQAANYRAKADLEGNFHLSGLEPGLYTLSVEVGDSAPLLRRGIRIEPNKATRISPKLVIERPPQLEISVSPVVDPWHRRWKLRLVAADRPFAIAEETATLEGSSQIHATEAGPAYLEVLDDDGQLWHRQLFDILPGRTELFLPIDVVEVRGRLYLGKETMGGALSFGTTQGDDIRAIAGEDGRFQAFLPREGVWPLEILWPSQILDAQRLRPVVVRRRPGKTYADLEIIVPATQLHGRVVMGTENAPHAGVTVVRDRHGASATRNEEGLEQAAPREAILVTDEEGRFSLRGLEPGRLSLLAQLPDSSSGWVRIDVDETTTEEVVLRLEKNISLHGSVSVGPVPLAGVKIVGLPELALPHSTHYVEATTEASGAFELKVPSGAIGVQLLIAASGFGLDLHHVRPAANGEWPPILIAVDGEHGILRLPLDLDAGARDFTAGLKIRRHGASFRLSAVAQALFGSRDLAIEGRELVLRGLAPGSWEVCREANPAECSSGEIRNGNELLLAFESKARENEQ